MTRKSFSIVALSVLCLAAITSLAQPRSSSNSGVAVNIPFDFVMGNRPLPAGTYTIQVLLNSLPGTGSIEIVGLHAGGRLYQTAVVDSETRPESQVGSRLVFHRYGGRSFLAEISVAATHLVFHPSQRQKELAAKLQGAEVELPVPADNSNGLQATASRAVR